MFSTDFYISYFQWIVEKLHKVADKHQEKAKVHQELSVGHAMTAKDAQREAERARGIANKIGSLFE